MRPLFLAGVVLAASMPLGAQSRLATDFEIARMREQITRSAGFVAQLSARLNLGDLLLARGQSRAGHEEYGEALSVAMADRVAARRDSDMTRYATSTAYAGLAAAKLGRGREAFEMMEEALRFTSDSAKTWNLYASAMSILGKTAKSLSAAENAVAIAAADLQRAPSVAARLDLAVYQYTLASALSERGDDRKAEPLLRAIIESLAAPAFDAVRRQVERSEAFEIYSTTRGEPAAYLSLLNRSRLRLAGLLEKRGDKGAAGEVYRRVLDQRTDDVTALAGLARLSSADEQARFFAAAFDANPFSISLIHAYQDHLGRAAKPASATPTTGGKVRRLLEQMHRGELTAARSSLQELERQFPENATLAHLSREIDRPVMAPAFLGDSTPRRIDPSPDDLRRLVAAAAGGRLTPSQRAALDAISFTSTVAFTAAATSAVGLTVLESGTIDMLRFRFSEPTAFRGRFEAGAPLRLTYRVLGVTLIDGSDALLLEPLGLEGS